MRPQGCDDGRSTACLDNVNDAHPVERGMVQAILAKLAAEDEAEAVTKARARDETVKVIEEFKAQRERAVEAGRRAEREEQHRIAEYLASAGKREAEAKAAKAEDAAVREVQYRAIVAEQEALRKKLEEEDALRWLLVEAEANRRRDEAERARRAREEANKRELKWANEQGRVIRERLAEQERAKEQRLIAQFLDKCREDDRNDALAHKAREEARARFQGEIAMQRELKVSLYEQQKLEEVRALEEAKRREEFKRRVIEEARRKLLEEHATRLRGFLPRGVITSSADLELLKAFDRNKDGQLEPEEMDLARAAFAAFDPGAARAGAAPAAPQAPAALAPPAPVPVASRNFARANASTVTFGGGEFDDKAARTRRQ